MINIEELNKTIEYLNELKKKEEAKQLENLKEKIKNELIEKLNDVLMHFESYVMVKFLEETGKEVCFDYNSFDVLEEIEHKLNVYVWECK